MSKVIKNINFLDLTGTSEASLEGVTMIKNINTLLYNNTVTNFLKKIALKNVNTSIEVPEKTKLIKGDFELDDSFGKSLGESIHLAVKGSVLVKPNVSSETLEKINGITLFGDVYCPEKLSGLIHQKIQNQLGKMVTFMDETDTILEEAVFNDQLIRSLKKGANIVVKGKATFLELKDTSHLGEKIGKIEFLDDVIMREEVMTVMGEKIQHPEKCKMKLIPEGSIYFDDDLHLDATSIERFNADLIYVAGNLQLSSDVTSEALDRSFEKIETEKGIICRKEVMDTVLKKCDDPAVKVLGYTGKLLVINGAYRLTQAELNYSKENLTIIVRGVLDIADNVDSEELYNKIDGVHNYGVVNGTDDQCGVIQTKLLTNHGVVGTEDDDDENDEMTEENVIANMNYLKL